MKNVILGAHVDDQIFSLGDYMQFLDDVVIVSVFAGIPAMSLDNAVGYKKHTLLRHEHDLACEVMGVKHIEGDFLDDVYGKQDKKIIENWLVATVGPLMPCKVYCPLAIHHPDHKLLRDAAVGAFLLRSDNRIGIDYFYKDLPYATLYPDELKQIEADLMDMSKTDIHSDSPKKLQAVKCYQSQIQNNHIIGEIMQMERIYG